MRRYLNAFAAGAALLTFAWLTYRMPADAPSRPYWPWFALAGAAIWLGMFLTWQHGRSGSAGLLGRWSRRSRRNRGVASYWSILRRASGWAMTSQARVLRPNVGLFAWVRPRDLATPLARVGLLRVWSSCEDVTLRVGGPRTGKSGELMWSSPPQLHTHGRRPPRARRRNRQVQQRGALPRHQLGVRPVTTEIVDLLDRFTTWKSVIAYLGMATFFGFGPGFILELLLRVAPDDDFDTRKAVMADLHALPYLKRWWIVAEQAVGVAVYGLPDRIRLTWWKNYASQPARRQSDIHYRILIAYTVFAGVGVVWDTWFYPVPNWFGFTLLPGFPILFAVQKGQRRLAQEREVAAADAAPASSAAGLRSDLLIAEADETIRLMSEACDKLNAANRELQAELNRLDAEWDEQR